MSIDLKEKPGWPYFILAGVLCFTMGCVYLLDIRIDAPAVAFGFNEFKWIHIGLLVIAVCMGASATSCQRARLACAIMIISEILGIIVWVGYLLLNDPENNLWPLGLTLFSGSGAIVISVGVLLGFLAGKPIRKKHNTRAGNKST